MTWHRSDADWLSVQEMAALLEVNENTIYRQVKAGGEGLPVPFLRVGALIRFPRARTESVLAAILAAPSSTASDAPSAEDASMPSTGEPGERRAS